MKGHYFSESRGEWVALSTLAYPHLINAHKKLMEQIACIDAELADREGPPIEDYVGGCDEYPSEEEIEEAHQTETLHKAALSRGRP